MSRFARGWPSLVTAALGAAGLAGSGPLAATLLVGRTAWLFPSLRWLLVAALWWAFPLAFALALLGRSRSMADRLLEACQGLVLTGAALPLLIALYLSDAAYQATVGGTAPPSRSLALYLAALAAVGPLGRRLTSHCPHHSPFSNSAGEAGAQAARGQRGEAERPERPVRPEVPLYVLGPLAAIAIMVLLNAGVFGALQRASSLGAQTIVLLLVQIALLVAAAAAAAKSVGGGWPIATGLLIAWLLFAPLQESLAVDWWPEGALVEASLALWLLSPGRPSHAAWALGVLSAFVPSASASILVFVAQRHWRAALNNAAIVGIVASLYFGEARAFDFGVSPHAANAALGGFFARMFAGPGALTAQSSDPHVVPALALAVGAAAVGGWLLWEQVFRARAARREGVLAALTLGFAGALLLAGTTPRRDLALAAVCLVPLANARLWSTLTAVERGAVAALAVTGYSLAGTSVEAMLRAAAEPLSVWPALASLPAFGLVLLWGALLIMVRASALPADERTVEPAVGPAMVRTPTPDAALP